MLDSTVLHDVASSCWIRLAGPLGDSCETTCCVWQSVSKAKILNGSLSYSEAKFSAETNEKVQRIELKFPKFEYKACPAFIIPLFWGTNMVAVTS